jgi:MIP family channel proteins
MDGRLSHALAAELVGTFALIFVGAGTAAIGLGGLVGVAFAHGLVVVGFAYAYGHLSGAHINPAVTLGVWAAGRMPGGRVAPYVAVQLAGGILGALALRFVLGGDETGLGATVVADSLAAGGTLVTITPAAGLVVEIVLTFFLVNAVMNAGISGKATAVAGLAIGMTLTFCILVGGPLTGASLNPARTLGPALAAGIWDDLWVYLVGPVVGALLAAALFRWWAEPPLRP